MPAIDVRNIVKKFGDFVAVKGLSFTVEDGEIFGLLGPNGAGKSTLIRMLTTLLPPTEGTAVISGFDVSTEADSVRRIDRCDPPGPHQRPRTDASRRTCSSSPSSTACRGRSGTS